MISRVLAAALCVAALGLTATVASAATADAMPRKARAGKMTKPGNPDHSADMLNEQVLQNLRGTAPMAAPPAAPMTEMKK